MYESRIETFLQDNHVLVKSARNSFICDCVSPSCGKEGHMWVKKSTGRSICFKCGSKWSWIALVAQTLKCSQSEARRIFYGHGAGDEIDLPLDIDLLFDPYSQSQDINDNPVYLGPDFIPAQNSSQAVDYLKSRNVNLDLISLYDLKYHAPMNAVIFPVKRDGIVYGWQARKIAPAEGELRLISAIFNKSRFLLNYDRAQAQNGIVLVEGPFDCLHVDIPGIGAVASLGKSVSGEQIKLLIESQASRIYLGLDPDACDEVYDIFNQIGFLKEVYRIVPPTHRKDFGEATTEEVKEAISRGSRMDSHIALLDVYFK